MHAIRISDGLLLGFHGCRCLSKAGRRNPILYLDVGGRGGLSLPWQTLWKSGVIKPVFVEPDTEEAARILGKYPETTVIETALFSRPTDR